MNRNLAIDLNAPTQEEREAHSRMVAAHNMKVSKANLASSLCEHICSGPDILAVQPDSVAKFAIAVAEFILETYSLMPDAAGNRGGIVS